MTKTRPCIETIAALNCKILAMLNDEEMERS